VCIEVCPPHFLLFVHAKIAYRSWRRMFTRSPALMAHQSASFLVTRFAVPMEEISQPYPSEVGHGVFVGWITLVICRNMTKMGKIITLYLVPLTLPRLH